MTNIEKRGQELLDFIAEHGYLPALVKGKFCNCSSVTCAKCDYDVSNMSCVVARELWLTSEYTEIPLDTEIDTPILVWDNGMKYKAKRYFAGFRDGKVMAWYDGRTSWNANGETHIWDHAEIADENEF